MLVGQLIAILLAAWVLARLAGVARLPPLIGMILGGALVAALPWPDTSLQPVSSPVRLAVLALVLLRAGLGLSVADLRRAGPLALRLGMLPLIGDVVLVALAGHLLLGLSLLPALALGFLVGAISPAIAIPGLLDLLEDVPESGRRAPAALLAASALGLVIGARRRRNS